MPKGKLYIVHCVDAEGPLYESLDATFDRINDLFGIEIERTHENIIKIQRMEIDFKGKEKEVAQIFSGHLNKYNSTWDDIDHMLDHILSPVFRNEYTDDIGLGWIFNWFILDHVGYVNNPRRRDIGYHNIFDHYINKLNQTKSYNDGLYWHFHPMSFYLDAHRCATSYVNSIHLYEGLARKVIEREWFPSVFRAGFQTERPDSNLFLEQWIPYDLTNTAKRNEDLNTKDMQRGRFNDWRLAPDDWRIYHPHHDYYQLEGNMRRWIGRCLNILNRFGNIDECEIEKAFKRANLGYATLVGVAGHDFRDLSREIDELYSMIQKVKQRYPDVQYINSTALDAFRICTYCDDIDPIKLEVDLDRSNKNESILSVKTIHGKVFGPQPFLAIKTKSQKFVHDNLDFACDLQSWSYTFDQESILPSDLEAVGIACNDKIGNSFIKVIKDIL